MEGERTSQKQAEVDMGTPTPTSALVRIKMTSVGQSIKLWHYQALQVGGTQVQAFETSKPSPSDTLPPRWPLLLEQGHTS